MREAIRGEANGSGWAQGRMLVRGGGRAALWAGLLLWLALWLLLGAGCARRSFETRGSVETFTAHLDGRIPRLMNRYGVPGMSVALVRDAELVWAEAYGYADREDGRRMTVDAVYRTESISKSVTAWGVMRLVEQGLVGLDDPVQQHLRTWKLPPSPYPRQEVTVRRLLSNTAGLPPGTIGLQYPPRGEVPSLRDALSEEARLIRQPGTSFLYSNPGFNLLELLVEELTGRDFPRYMAQEVLLPLGMGRSSYAWSENLDPAIPSGYDLRGKAVPLYVYSEKGSGGLFAEVRDIARFVAAGMRDCSSTDQAVLGPEAIRRVHTPEVGIPGLFAVVADAYGFGHFVETLPDGRQAVWHGGQGNGWMSHFHAVPQSGDGIVILTNSQRSWPVMAQVLRDWARWSGLGSVKMGRITYGIVALQVLIGIVVLLSLWLVYRLVRGLAGRRRVFAPLSGRALVVRLLQTALGIGVIAALAWSAAQPYLFVSSVFPGISGRAGLALLVLAIVMVVSALFPRTERRTGGNGYGSAQASRRS